MTAPKLRSANRRATSAAWVATLTVAALIDLAYGREASLTVTLVFGPFVASALASPRETATAALSAVALGVALGWPDGTAGSSPQLIRVAAVAAGGALAVRLTVARTHREDKLRALTRVAEIAQQAVLRPLPPRLGPLSLTTLYLSATAEARIGGDFYDATDTPWGVRLLVGDVRGKGLDAVRLAAALLGEFRSRAQTEPTLADIVERVETVAGSLVDTEEFATAIFLEVRGGEIEIVRCGHPHPLMVDANGSVSELTVVGTLPIALGADAKTSTTIAVPPGSRLLLYSDGAIETRDRHGEDFDLAGALTGVAADPAGVALETILRRLAEHGGGDIDDDVVLLLVDLDPHDGRAGEAITTDPAARRSHG